MNTDSIKMTDSLERELNRREIEAVHGIAFTGMTSLASDSLQGFLRAGAALGAVIDLLRQQARAAKVDYAAS